MMDSDIANEELQLQRSLLKASEELQKRTESKVTSAKEWLGKRYLLHPANRVRRLNTPQSVLGRK
jgi:hypothetical protein